MYMWIIGRIYIVIVSFRKREFRYVSNSIKKKLNIRAACLSLPKKQNSRS